MPRFKHFFRFHLATLLLASVAVSLIIYLNLAHRRDPRIYAYSHNTYSIRFSTTKEGCTRQTTRHSGYYLIRCYVANPGWPFSLWPESLNSYSFPIGEIPRSTDLLVERAEWEAPGFTATGYDPHALYTDDVFIKAPQLAAKLFVPVEPVVHRPPEINAFALAANILIGLGLSLLPAVLLEVRLRRQKPADVAPAPTTLALTSP